MSIQKMANLTMEKETQVPSAAAEADREPETRKGERDSLTACKERLYGKLNISVRALDVIIGVSFVLLAAVIAAGITA